MRLFIAVVCISFFCWNTQLLAQCPEGFWPGNENLVVNGDFEQGNQAFLTGYEHNPVDLWLEGYYAVGTNPSIVHPHFINIGDHTTQQGKMMVVNGAEVSGKVVWEQPVEGIYVGIVYAVSAWATTVSSANRPAILQFSINDQLLDEPFKVASYYEDSWKQFTAYWTAEDVQQLTLSIVNQNTVQGGNDFVLDDISFVPCFQYAWQEHHVLDESIVCADASILLGH
ncbi:MAG: hypothetical protein GY810_06365 [Aureispira sp.]|nr:hypothetical protein [Aureispira sp.]